MREVLQLAVERVEREEEIVKALKQGRSTLEILGLQEILLAEGLLEQ